MKNRTAWGLAAILAVVLLGSAALLLFQVVSAYLQQRALVDAAKRDDVGAIQALLDHGVSVNTRDKFGTAFEYAVQTGDTRAVSAFLVHGANVNALGPSRGTPLQMAVEYGRAAIVDLLLAHGADPDACDRFNGTTPLMVAADHGRSEIVRALIAHGANVNAKNTAGVTPLMMGVTGGRPAVVRLLLAHGVDVKAKDYLTGQPDTALTLAEDFLSHARKERRFEYASDYATIVRLLREARGKE